MNNCRVYRDCGAARLVCTDYSRNSYLPSVPVNETGERILRGILGGRSVRDIASELSDEATDSKEVERDIRGFLSELRKKGFTIEEQ